MSTSQNIYDDPQFFDEYKKLRGNQDSANNLEEKPALFSLSPNLNGKTVLDLGCGYGENCPQFYEMGAKKVVGIDISEKMLAVARQENPAVEFRLLDMNDLSPITEKFDVVFSSLAVHYIEDFNHFVASVVDLLNEGGNLVFSQEHPLTTAPINGASWTRDEQGNIVHYNLTDYARSGERRTYWFVENVIKYHRTFSEVVNTLVQNGLVIEKLLEPVPSQETLERLPKYEKGFHKPNFLVVRGRRV